MVVCMDDSGMWTTVVTKIYIYILYIFSIYLKHLMYMKYLEVLFIFKKSPFWNLKEGLFSWATFPFEPAHVFSCLKLHCYLLWNEMYTEYVQDFWHCYFPNLSLFIHVWWWMCALWVIRMLLTKSWTLPTIPLSLWIYMPVMLSPLHPLLAIISPSLPLENFLPGQQIQRKHGPRGQSSQWEIKSFELESHVAKQMVHQTSSNCCSVVCHEKSRNVTISGAKYCCLVQELHHKINKWPTDQPVK